MTRRCLPLVVTLATLGGAASTALANPSDEWWDLGWPYRIPISVAGTGVVEVSVDFTAELSTLGLNQGLLDVRSLRVVPYMGSTPGTC